MSSATYIDKVMCAADFLRRDLPQRQWLVRDWIPHPSVGMVYAWRGSGKTMTALALALQIARGAPWMGHETTAQGVLYIDGEMAASELQERLRLLSGGSPPERLWLLCSEDLAVARRGINLALPECREGLAATLVALERTAGPIGLVILDNWSSLVWGIDENETHEIDPIRQWLVMMRHGECSVILIHHEGKGGAQRGTSAREDNLNWSVRLTKVAEDARATRIRFVLDKCRGPRPFPDRFIQVFERAGAFRHEMDHNLDE